MKKLGKLSLKEMENEMPVIGSNEQKKFIGGSDGDWTYFNGQWCYVADDVDIWADYAAEIPDHSTFSTYGDWSSSNGNNVIDNTLSAIIGAVPVASNMYGAIQNKINGEKWEANTILINSGCIGSDSIRFDFVVGDDLGMYYDLYGANGNFIGTTK